MRDFLWTKIFIYDIREFAVFAVSSVIDVFMPPIRDRIKTRFVKKTLSLPADLAAEADESGVNCSRLFQKALYEYLHGNGKGKKVTV